MERSKNRILNTLERKVIILAGDLLIIYGSLYLYINDAIDDVYFSLLLEFFIFFLGITLYLFLSYVLDFYNLEKANRLNSILSQCGYIIGLFVIIIFFTTILVFDASFWRWPLFFFLVFTPIQIFLWRLLYKNTFRFIPTVKKVLYVYDSYNEHNNKNHIENINGNKFETFYRTKLTIGIDNNFKIKKSFIRALDKIDTCIINIKDYNGLPNDVEKIVLKLIEEGKEVLSYTSFYENIYEALPVQSHNDSFYEILQLRNKRVRYLQSLFTILTNFILCFFIGLFLLFIIPFVYFFNLFFNRGPLFYTQKRVGKFNREFKIYKFRSMIVDAEKGGAKMATYGDSRITPFGKILRKIRVDELPQILSVIKGDMTFIGPRPERKVFTEQLNKITPFYNIRHIIKPGITGWAQIKYKYGENLEDSIKKLEYDLYYIKNRSITLDIRIIFKTITTVLFSRGV